MSKTLPPFEIWTYARKDGALGAVDAPCFGGVRYVVAADKEMPPKVVTVDFPDYQGDCIPLGDHLEIVAELKQKIRDLEAKA